MGSYQVAPHHVAVGRVPDQKAKSEDDLETLTQALLTLEHGEEIGVDALDGPLATILLCPQPPTSLDVGIPGILHLWVIIQFDRGILIGLSGKSWGQFGAFERRVAELLATHPGTH